MASSSSSGRESDISESKLSILRKRSSLTKSAVCIEHGVLTEKHARSAQPSKCYCNICRCSTATLHSFKYSILTSLCTGGACCTAHPCKLEVCVAMECAIQLQEALVGRSPRSLHVRLQNGSGYVCQAALHSVHEDCICIMAHSTTGVHQCNVCPTSSISAAYCLMNSAYCSHSRTTRMSSTCIKCQVFLAWTQAHGRAAHQSIMAI
jgi:hypothetical protein